MAIAEFTQHLDPIKTQPELVDVPTPFLQAFGLTEPSISDKSVAEPSDNSRLTEEDWKGIVRNAKAGSLEVRQAAFSVIYDHYTEPIQKYIGWRMGMDPEEAENLMQETFLKAWDNISKTNDELRLGAWLFRIATNLSFSEIRKRGTVAKYKHQVATVTCETPDVSEDPLQSILDSEAKLEVDAVLGMLSPQYGDALRLQLYANLSYADIATALNKSFSGAQMLVFRARAEFREKWAEFQSRRSSVDPRQDLLNSLVRQSKPELEDFFSKVETSNLDKIAVLARTLFASGQSVDQINKILQLESPGDVYQLIDHARDTHPDLWPDILEAMKVKQPEKARIVDREVADLRTRYPKLTYAQIAAKMHVLPSRVNESINRQPNILRTKKSKTEEAVLDAEVRKYVKAGLMYKEIARLLKEKQRTIKSSVARQARHGELSLRRPLGKTRHRVSRLLRRHMTSQPGVPINLSVAAKQLGIRHSLIHAYYNQIAKKQEVPPKYRPGQCKTYS